MVFSCVEWDGTCDVWGKTESVTSDGVVIRKKAVHQKLKQCKSDDFFQSSTILGVWYLEPGGSTREGRA